MRSKVVNFREKLARFSEHWSPKVIAEMNGYEFKLVKIQGEFTWHDHPDTDEVFIVISGNMEIELRGDENDTVALGSGEMYVVPKGVEHKPYAQEECEILLVEPRGVVNTGEAGGELRSENVWI